MSEVARESGLRGPLKISQAECYAKLPAHLHRWKEDEHGCWIWTGSRNPVTGYAGNTSAKGWGKANAYRLIWQIMNDTKLEKGYAVVMDHLCNRGPEGCVNPNHIIATTQRENSLRADSPITKNAFATHCVNGHEFTPENTIYPNKTEKGKVRTTWRRCRKCAQAQTRKWAQENRERQRELGRESYRRMMADPERKAKLRERQKRSRDKKRLERAS